MNERLVTSVCAFGAMVLFLTMFVDGAGPGGEDVPRPTTQDRHGNGYRAALEWLDAEHIHTMSWRGRFDRLSQHTGMAAQGNVLVVTLPAKTAYRADEFRAVDRWVRSGNTLLVLAALSDNPDWAHAMGGQVAGDLNLLTGLEFETVRNRELRLRNAARAPARRPALDVESRQPVSIRESITRRFAEPQHAMLIANRPHAYLTGVSSAVALSDFPSQPWTVKVPYDGFIFALAHQQDTGDAVLWIRPLGAGHIVVSAFGSMFTNRAIGLGDNARLLANIVGTQLGPNSAVLFDDVHQGLGDAYDPSKFYRDRRLYLTLGILALVWLSWVLGATRLRIPATRVAAPQDIELVRATGGFLARVLTSAAAARLMFEHLLRRVSWESLARHPRIAQTDLEQLKRWYADANASARIPLIRLHNLILRIQRQLNS